jgi:hypothetical protein
MSHEIKNLLAFLLAVVLIPYFVVRAALRWASSVGWDFRYAHNLWMENPK